MYQPERMDTMTSVAQSFLVLTELLPVIPWIAGIACTVIAVWIISICIKKRKLTHAFTSNSNSTHTFSAKEREKLIKQLARAQKNVCSCKYNHTMMYLTDYAYKHLRKIRRQLSGASSEIITLVPAARWIFDNYYTLYTELKKIQGANGRKRSMWILSSGAGKGYPRVYMIARECIAISGLMITEEALVSALQEYQTETPLTSAELWSVPEIVSICLLENIIQVADDILKTIRVKLAAEEFICSKSSQLKFTSELADVLQLGIYGKYAQDYCFISHVIYRLKNMAIDEAQISCWLTSIGSKQSSPMNPSQIITKESRFEANLESVTRSLIVSLREMKSLNSKDLFEAVSLVEHILRQDPAGVYKRMDFESRNAYRQALEKLSLRFHIPEWELAEKIRLLAASSLNTADLHCSDHVGTYLVGNGRPKLSALLKGKQTKKAPGKRSGNYLGIGYFVSVSIFFAVIFDWIYFVLTKTGYSILNGGAITLICVAVPIVVGIALEITNCLFTRLIPTKRLQCLDFIGEIPDDCRTFVVMPVLLESPDRARHCASRMEKHYLANKQKNLYYAILCDFSDAPDRVMQGDSDIVSAATEAVMRLNNKYPADIPIFSFFVRYRQWNESEGCWMGWERKRGKLAEFNALLCGEDNTSFTVVSGYSDFVEKFKYIITLDADTDLIRDSAAKLVGTMEHPLNRPVIDPKGDKITEGYAIIQSEVRNHLLSKETCMFSEIFAGHDGLDVYSNVVSDIYQDAFHQGIYVGKGIYDVRVFHSLLNKKFPDNSVLSHDLLESCYVRCAFSSGIVLMDSFPSGIAAYARREHRWIRGDWQLLPWLFLASPINPLSRWKILDNMRRSLIPVSQMLLLCICTIFLPKSFFLWIPLIFFNDALKFVFFLLKILVQKLRNPRAGMLLANINASIMNIFNQAAVSFIMMPYRAWIAVDAIARTLFRLFISRKKLLQWQASELTEKKVKNTFTEYLAMMWEVIFPVLLLLYAELFITKSLAVGTITAIVSLLWLLSPAIAYLLSAPLRPFWNKDRISSTEKQEVRLLARRTWQFFKDFTTAENNWLCPDNYQLSPVTKISDKTSPTNIGLQLLAFLSARDLGYIGLFALTDTYENIFKTLERLPQLDGLLYNWYEIKTLAVLDPRYISTVDCGNYIGFLMTLKNGLSTLCDQPVFPASIIDGLRDTIILSGCDMPIPEGVQSVSALFEILCGTLQDMTSRPINPWENEQWTNELRSICEDFIYEAEVFGRPDVNFGDQKTLRQLAEEGSTVAISLVGRLEHLIETMKKMIEEADFTLLYNSKRQLFHIGYHVPTRTVDGGFYDLAASEALLTSFIAIAKGNVPQKHWYSLGRPLTVIRGVPALVSWSGTMFEYLMPHLILKDYPRSTFSLSHHAAVRQQMIYAAQMKIPWGMSESQYFCFDTDSNYQYKAFGVPKLRLEPGINTSLVISPYSTLIAISMSLRKAMKNIRALKRLGAEGHYGFYEALDFNRPNVSSMVGCSIVKSFMAHHLGMSLVSLDNLLYNNVMQLRFHSEPMVQATEVLLEETLQTNVVTVARKGYAIDIKQAIPKEDLSESRYINSTTSIYPSVNWLSNGAYALMTVSDGDGFSCCNDIMLHRWRSDRCSSYGNYIYIRDIRSGKFWSAAYKPTLLEPDGYQVVFSKDKTEFIRHDGVIATHMAVTLSAKENLEVRKVTMTNHGNEGKILEVTSYFEVVMDKQAAELAHPCFNKLFLENEYIPEQALLLYKRRSRSGAASPYLMHTVKTEETLVRPVEFETNRLRFLGRNRTPARPAAFDSDFPLSNVAGFSDDPIACLRASVFVPAGRSVSVSFISGVCTSREDAVRISSELEKERSINDVFEQFRLNSILELKYLNITSSQANQYLELVGPLFYPVKEMRGPAECLERNWKDQSGLWRFSISGDNPMMLLRVSSAKDVVLIDDVLNTYQFLRTNRIPVDLVVLNEQPVGYFSDLNNILFERTSLLKTYAENTGKASVFILQAWQMNQAEIDLILTTARIVFSSKTGVYFRKERKALEELWNKKPIFAKLPTQFNVLTSLSTNKDALPRQVEFFNGIGGFIENGTEYEILLDSRNKPPMPWINVIANEQFGFQVSETGAGYTWALNSRENKLTTWSNDPVMDLPSEAIYIQDDATGEVFSPCSLGLAQKGCHRVRHGFGYSVFSYSESQVDQTLTMFVPLGDPVRLWHLQLTNNRNVQRHLTVTLYVEFVLGVDRETGAPYIVTSFDTQKETLTAKSIYNFYFRHQTAFLFSSEKIISYSGDRLAFLGCDGSLEQPNRLDFALSQRVGSGLDPCGLIQISVSLNAGETKDVIFGLGQSENQCVIDDVRLKYKSVENVATSLNQVKEYWQTLLSQVTVTTNDRAMDIMANGWLQYQTLSCRIMARAAFYQCGGAYGYRDQLQDVLALLGTDPARVRNQILISASHQFQEGDVQHWWHPYTGQGVRTRVTDDLLWLAYVTALYIKHSGDYTVLDETVSFLSGRELNPNESEALFATKAAEESASVYDHCLRALNRVTYGQHGLPLMGGGDWNDGMNRVGIKGMGESVWLGWFLLSIFREFAPLCDYKNDHNQKHMFSLTAAELLKNIEENAWDGEWYLRAFYDDGQKLGSINNQECRIDSIAQSWAVISGAGDRQRAQCALHSAERFLVKLEEGVILLLAPPFGQIDSDPGYIKDYYPGVRENGGQYTHAATWLAIANAMLKNSSVAYELLKALNPINTTASNKEAVKYKKEPYVMTADICNASPYIGQGGWSWYTGSSGWMYQAIVSWFLGIRREGSRLLVDPAVPHSFGDYIVRYRFGSSVYVLNVTLPKTTEQSSLCLCVDGEITQGNSFILTDDGKSHDVQICY